MPLEIDLATGDLFDPHSPLAGFDLNDLVHQQERPAMGDDGLDFSRAEHHRLRKRLVRP